jgi:hypothetical protein
LITQKKAAQPFVRSPEAKAKITADRARHALNKQLPTPAYVPRAAHTLNNFTLDHLKVIRSIDIKSFKDINIQLLGYDPYLPIDNYAFDSQQDQDKFQCYWLNGMYRT